MIGFNGSSTGDGRVTGLRGCGVADDNASRTVRRCVENRRANSRTDTPGSTRRALRICSNNSTFDLFAMNPTVHERTGRRGGYLSARWGQIRRAQPAQVGPKQVTRTSRSVIDRHLWRDHEVPLFAVGLDEGGVEFVDGDAGACRVVAKLIYASNMSLDGWTEDDHGAFDWAPPDDDVFVFITELMRSAGTYLYGRRMYETLAVWETDTTLANHSDLTADYASAWQAADKVVYSSTLAAPHTANTRLERDFSPSAVRDLKAAAERDLDRGPEPGSAGSRRRPGRRAGPVRLADRPRWAHPRIGDRYARRSDAHRRAPVQQPTASLRALPLTRQRLSNYVSAFA